jgi:hypothetical protein
VYLVADLGEDRARPGLADILDDKAQRAIEVLPGAQHDREFAGDLAERGAVEPAPSAEFDLQQIAQTPAPVCRLGAQHDLALALQALDNRGAVGSLGDAVHHQLSPTSETMAYQLSKEPRLSRSNHNLAIARRVWAIEQSPFDTPRPPL